MRLLHLIAEGDATQTHHWMWPEKAEIIYGGISSIIIFAALFKFAGPAAKKAMAARTERIQKELDNAANTRSAAEAEASNDLAVTLAATGALLVVLELLKRLWRQRNTG